MLCLKHRKINITNIGREIKSDCNIATLCINMLMLIFLKSYIHLKRVQDSTQKFISNIFYDTLKKIRYNYAMLVVFNIMMDNYN
jgi:hypothetical protein